MRIIVFFDLPMLTLKDLKAYRYFRKGLIKNGFIMLQQSVYAKLVLNNTIGNRVKNEIHRLLPAQGLVQMLTITEKQFSNIDFLLGEGQTEVIDNDNRIIRL